MRRLEAALGIVAAGLLLGGAGLALEGASFVSVWLAFAAWSQSAPACPPEAFCPALLMPFGLLPDPFPIFVTYLMAMPMGIATGYALDRLGRTVGTGEPRAARVLRIQGRALAASMVWMAVLYTAGGLSGTSLSPRYPSLLGLGLLVSFLVVPSLVMGVGGSLLVHVISERLSARKQVDRG